MIGQTLAHYKILEKIGSGGMGDVYLAEDTKLDRKIALKVLPPELAENEERRARFQREAKAIAALNHLNIVTVHSVEEFDGVHFMTMELVKGKTLAELISNRGMELSRFFDIASRLADAVAAAHEAGIIHRDLKPSNVMVGEDGVIKVLDFGLAQTTAPIHVEGDSESPTALKTQEGVLAGTLHYMSPEQTEAKSVDARTDIFSLGVIFYEVLTGQRPFTGASSAAVLSSILKDEPVAVNELRPQVPAGVVRIVRRCLTKDLKRRFQNARDVLVDLEECRDEAPRDATPTELLGRRAAPAGLALLVLGGFLGYWLRGEGSVSSPDAPLRLANPVQVTFEEGLELYPDWSPDGQMLAYLSQQSRSPLGRNPGSAEENRDIWVAQLGGTQPVNRTADHLGLDAAPSWSPGGRELAFLSDREGDAGVFAMSPLGGTPRKLGVVSGSGDARVFGRARGSLQWLADGTKLGAAVVGEDGVDVAEILTLSTGETRHLSLPGRRTGRIHLRWSPDEHYLAYVAALAASNETTQLWVLRVSDGEAVPITDGMTHDLSPSWSADSSALHFISNRGGGMDLWRQPMDSGTPDGEPERVTAGIGMRQAIFSPDGTKLAYVKGQRVANLWRVPILEDRPATWLDAEQLSFDEAYIEFVDVSSDGSRLVVSSNRSGNQDVWSLPAVGDEMLRLTTDLSPDWDPHWSPDGRQVAFYSNRSGNRDIWVMPTSGGAARQLTTHEGSDLLLSWSPDGSELVFSSDRNGSNDMWLLALDGGAPRRLTTGFRTAWSPSGRWIAMDRPGETGLWRVSVAGGEAEKLTGENGRAPKWAPDERRLYFLNRRNIRDEVWAVSLADGGARAMTDLSGRPGRMSDSALATDGKYLYFAWGPDTADLWVMDVVTDDDP